MSAVPRHIRRGKAERGSGGKGGGGGAEEGWWGDSERAHLSRPPGSSSDHP